MRLGHFCLSFPCLVTKYVPYHTYPSSLCQTKHLCWYRTHFRCRNEVRSHLFLLFLAGLLLAKCNQYIMVVPPYGFGRHTALVGLSWELAMRIFNHGTSTFLLFVRCQVWWDVARDTTTTSTNQEPPTMPVDIIHNDNILFRLPIHWIFSQ